MQGRNAGRNTARVNWLLKTAKPQEWAFRPGLAQIRAQLKVQVVRAPVLNTKIGHVRGIVVATRPLLIVTGGDFTRLHVATPQGAYPPGESVLLTHRTASCPP